MKGALIVFIAAAVCGGGFVVMKQREAKAEDAARLRVNQLHTLELIEKTAQNAARLRKERTGVSLVDYEAALRELERLKQSARASGVAETEIELAEVSGRLSGKFAE